MISVSGLMIVLPTTQTLLKVSIAGLSSYLVKGDGTVGIRDKQKSLFLVCPWGYVYKLVIRVRHTV